MTAPEFSHRVPVEKLSARAQELVLTANADERAALARRFDLLAVDRLEARLSAERRGQGAYVAGTVEAEVVQRCVVSGEPVPARLTVPVALTFTAECATESDIELDAQALDTLPVDGGAIDLGEAVAQSLLLALDPYPRADAATLADARALLLSEDEAQARAAAEKAQSGPFAGLKRP